MSRLPDLGPRGEGWVIIQFLLLLLVFVTVPVILYTEFRQADIEKQTLLLESVREHIAIRVAGQAGQIQVRVALFQRQLYRG